MRLQTITLIHADGTEESREIPYDEPFEAIDALVGTDDTESIFLKDGRTLWIDGTKNMEAMVNGDRKPVNMKATELLSQALILSDTVVIPLFVWGDACLTNSEEFGYDIKTGTWGNE